MVSELFVLPETNAPTRKVREGGELDRVRDKSVGEGSACGEGSAVEAVFGSFAQHARRGQAWEEE